MFLNDGCVVGWASISFNSTFFYFKYVNRCLTLNPLDNEYNKKKTEIIWVRFTSIFSPSGAERFNVVRRRVRCILESIWVVLNFSGGALRISP